jgi:hypothetical protein
LPASWAGSGGLGGVCGPGWCIRQDPLFAFRLLADIGLRALSPAVNDPATAVQVLDTMQSILSPLVTRDLDVADIADGSGAVRLVLAPARPRSHGRQLPGDLARRRQPRPRMSLGRKPITTSAVCG